MTNEFTHPVRDRLPHPLYRNGDDMGSAADMSNSHLGRLVSRLPDIEKENRMRTETLARATVLEPTRDTDNPLSPAARAFIDLEGRAQKLEQNYAELERENSGLAAEVKLWKQRCLDAETKRDHYARYAVELLTRIATIKTNSERLIEDVDVIVNEAKQAVFKAHGAPAPADIQLAPEDEERLKDLANKLRPLTNGDRP